MFLASTSSIFTYDGSVWNSTLVKRGAAIRQIHYDSLSSLMYLGAVSDFGYLKQDSDGYYMYHNFLDQLTEEQKVFSDVWKIHQLGNKIYFQSSERIFIVEGKKVTGIIESEGDKTFALMFQCGGKLFVRQRTAGLMEIRGTSLVMVKNSESFATTRLMGMMPLDGNTHLLLTGDQGFLKLSGMGTDETLIEPLLMEGDTFLSSAGVLGCKWISANEFGVCSRNGFMIYTRDLKPKVLFNKKSGLPDESISEFFIDREANIWLTHNNGCSMISYTVPGLLYTDQIGFEGTLEMLEFVGDTIYLGTSEGLFRSDGPIGFGDPLHFVRLPVKRTEVWNIKPIGSSLLACTSEGLIELVNNESKELTTYYTNQVAWVEKNEILLAAEKGGFSILRKEQNNSWNLIKHFELPGIELIRIADPISIESSGKGPIYFLTALSRFKTIVFIKFNLDTMLSYREYGPTNGLSQEDCFPIQLGDTVYFVSYREAYRYVPSADKGENAQCFRLAPDIFKLFFDKNETDIRSWVDHRLFVERPNDMYTTFFLEQTGKKSTEKILLGGLFSGGNIQFGVVRKNGTAWILSQQALIQYDLQTPIDTGLSFQAIITRARFARDSNGIFYPGVEISIPYNRNSVLINFAAPYFVYDMGMRYRYRLLGYDTAWAGITSKPEKEYTNLPEGTYTFVVEAANAFGMISREARYTFTILPPWYRTTWAYTLYVLGFIVVIYGAVRISAHRLRKQKELLEETVRLRTAEIDAQKREIEEKNRHMIDSIQYAKRIQQSILPTEKYIVKNIDRLTKR